jgi:hypothetical protein
MNQPPKLNFPSIRLRGRRVGEQAQIWDEERRMWLVLTPEEWVRQHLKGHLVAACGVIPTRMVAEYPVPLNGQAQRADLVVVDDAGRPLLLAECKALEVPIDRSTLHQAVRYNSVFGARHLILTNGLRHYCYERLSDVDYQPLADFPKL